MTQDSSVKPFSDESLQPSSTVIFDRLRALQDELFKKVRERFVLNPDLSTARFQPYTSLDGSTKGSLAAFSGPEIDWLVYSWIGNPAMSYCNIRLTIWLGSQIRVPHLAFAFGTFPVLFFLMDYIPRVDVVVNPDYVDRYMEPANKRFLELQADKRFSPFISQSTYIRETISQAGLNFTCPPNTKGALDLIRTVSHEYLDRWLKEVNKAEPVPEAERPALARRDLEVRRSMAERDPANVVAARIYGPELTNALVRGFWGGDRMSPRPAIG